MSGRRSGDAPAARSYEVAKLSDIPAGSHVIVEAGGKSIGVYNIGGELYAIRNICPHQGAELCKGLVTPLVVSSGPGSFEYEREGEIVRCPWHQWEFDIKTGFMVVDPETRTMCYDVSVERYDVELNDGAVIVNIQ